MDPTTALLYLVSGFGLSVVGLATVVLSGSHAARSRAARDAARRAAVVNARWEARTIPLADEWMRVQLVRVAQLGDDRWIVDRKPDYVDVPVEDTTALINAQVEAQEAACAANQEERQ